MGYLPADLYAQVERSVPIVCVDFVPTRRGRCGREVGLILRESPHGRVWCHLGGRILRGETVAAALRRHGRETIGLEPLLAANVQPDYVYEWFPEEIAPDDGTVFGDDPRKHAIGLSFAIEVEGVPEARNEALAFDYFDAADLPTGLWPGCRELLHRLNLVPRSA